MQGTSAGLLVFEKLLLAFKNNLLTGARAGRDDGQMAHGTGIDQTTSKVLNQYTRS